jgi:hypothetical protein
MKQNNADYQVVPYPKMRRLEAAMLRSAQRTPMIHGLSARRCDKGARSP